MKDRSASGNGAGGTGRICGARPSLGASTFSLLLCASTLAFSAFHSSMNYRSLMMFGQAFEVTDEQQKERGLDRLVDHLLPGRSAEVRKSTRKELNATSLLALPIETFSIKTRSGPPGDAAADLEADVWAGVIPLHLAAGSPEDAPDLRPGLKPKTYFQG